jgi:hypothetical protein
MRTVAVLLVCGGLLGISRADQRKNSTGSRTANEPFQTFELIDSRLSVLTKQQDDLKRALFPTPGRATSTKPNSRLRHWAKAAQNIQQTSKSIRMLATRQERRYSRLKQNFGVRAFKALRVRARAVETTAGLLRHTQADSLAARNQAILEKQSLALVLQFQAITGGYGATRCSAGHCPCCEPKAASHAPSERIEVACKWVCVASAPKCAKGFTGPVLPK